MNADRIEWYANQLRGIQVADIPRKVRSILMDATNEARRAERERVAELILRTDLGGIPKNWQGFAADGLFKYAEAIRAME